MVEREATGVVKKTVLESENMSPILIANICYISNKKVAKC